MCVCVAFTVGLFLVAVEKEESVMKRGALRCVIQSWLSWSLSDLFATCSCLYMLFLEQI